MVIMLHYSSGPHPTKELDKIRLKLEGCLEILVSGAGRDLSHLATNGSRTLLQPRSSLEVFLTESWNRGVEHPHLTGVQHLWWSFWQNLHSLHVSEGSASNSGVVGSGHSFLEHLGTC